MGLTIELAIAKTNKYASRESGDTAELVERPGGGFSVVMADGQGSGRAAKSLSLLVTSKAVGLLKEGVRDGAVARGVHDYLFAYRHGKVSATLDILSVDLRSGTIVVTRNAETPMLLGCGVDAQLVPGSSGPIGLYHHTRPAITQRPMEAGLRVVLFSDGVVSAGSRSGSDEFDLLDFAGRRLLPELRADAVADELLDEAIRRDDGRPADDMTVVGLTLREHADPILVRRVGLSVPLP